MMFKMLDTIFDFRKNKFFYDFSKFSNCPPCPPGGRIWTNMERAQLGPPMVHMAKFDQNRLKDLGARRVDDRQTHTQTRKQTQAIIMAILRIGPIIRAILRIGPITELRGLLSICVQMAARFVTIYPLFLPVQVLPWCSKRWVLSEQVNGE